MPEHTHSARFAGRLVAVLLFLGLGLALGCGGDPVPTASAQPATKEFINKRMPKR